MDAKYKPLATWTPQKGRAFPYRCLFDLEAPLMLRLQSHHPHRWEGSPIQGMALPKWGRKKNTTTQLPPKDFSNLIPEWYNFPPKPLVQKLSSGSFFFLGMIHLILDVFFFSQRPRWFTEMAAFPTYLPFPFRRWFHRVHHNVHTMEVMIYQRWAASIETGGKFGGKFLENCHSEGYE